MSKKPEITENDLSSFRDAMRGVKPLAPSNKVTLKTPVESRPKTKIKEAELDTDLFSDYETLDPVSSEDILEFAQPGIQHKVLRNLRNGKYNIEAILDLHGKTAIEARQYLNQFLKNCQRKGIRHALIIHGKGRTQNKPILKNKLNHWLRQTTDVLAFCSATTRDGRSGALYVLLKNSKQELIP